MESIKNIVTHTCAGCSKEAEAPQGDSSPDGWRDASVWGSGKQFKLVACSDECVAIGYVKKVCKSECIIVRPADHVMTIPVLQVPTSARVAHLLNATDSMYKMAHTPMLASVLRGQSAKKLTGMFLVFRRGA